MKDRRLILTHVLPHAYMALGYYLWASDYKHILKESVLTAGAALDLGARVEIDYMEFGLAQGSLVAFRKFDDFFGQQKSKRPDDLHVTDFLPGFELGGFLSKE